jgi:hypothetical protein
MAAAERHEFEKKALSVIERLLEVPVEEEFFLNAVQHMEPRHYDDVVEERSILNLCGYPLCCKALGDVPKQKYHISLANKKVYDLSQRKKFCSNSCFKCSNYYASQLPTTPIWTRDTSHIPNVKLLPMDHTCTKSSNSFSHETKRDSLPSNIAELTQDEQKHSYNGTGSSDSLITQLSVPSTLTASGGELSELPISRMTGSMSEIMGEVLLSWCTADTVLFLTNPVQSVSNYSKQQVTAGPVIKKENDGTKPEDSNQKCGNDLKSEGKKLDVVEQEMEMTDEVMEKLRRFQVNVNTGRFIDDLTVCGIEDLKEEESKQSAPVPVMEKLDRGPVVVKEHHAMKDEDLDPVLPLVDSRSQMAIRQRIVLDQLNKSYGHLLRETQLSVRDFSRDLNKLVHTFRLLSGNVALKPAQWKILAIILLHSLNSSPAVNNAALSKGLVTYRVHERLHQCLMDFKVSDEDMNSLISIFGIAWDKTTPNQ